MTYTYSPEQASIVIELLQQARADELTQEARVYTSPFEDLTVLVSVVRIDIDNGGGGGLTTDWTEVKWDGTVVRDAAKAKPFGSFSERIYYFNNLVEIAEP